MIITIDTSNAAFDDHSEIEIARILRDLAEKLERGEQPVSIYDVNGNKVCKITYDE